MRSNLEVQIRCRNGGGGGEAYGNCAWTHWLTWSWRGEGYNLLRIGLQQSWPRSTTRQYAWVCRTSHACCAACAFCGELVPVAIESIIEAHSVPVRSGLQTTNASVLPTVWCYHRKRRTWISAGMNCWHKLIMFHLLDSINGSLPHSLIRVFFLQTSGSQRSEMDEYYEVDWTERLTMTLLFWPIEICSTAKVANQYSARMK